MSKSDSMRFFDSIADKWDSWEDLPALRATLDEGLRSLGLGGGEHVLDVGCGTGNLTEAILRRLSPSGRVMAIDLSPLMLEAARAKIDDERVRWQCGDVADLAPAEGPFDRIFCYSVWPHLAGREQIARRLLELLKPGGAMHIWHTISRKQVNAIHATASEAVRDHILPPARQTAEQLDAVGFEARALRDDEDGYLVTATRPATNRRGTPPDAR